MTIAILGIGKTGLALANFFAKTQTVWGIDDRRNFENPEPRIFEKIFLGGEIPPFDNVERFFISPGVDPRHPAVQAARSWGLKIEGELDIAFDLCPGEVYAIGGTNGKSTTTALLGHIFTQAGFSTQLGGNFDIPFLDLVLKYPPAQKYIIEVSSFQLETTQSFRPKVSVLLNISEDHLDRYQDFYHYVQTKGRTFLFQNSDDYAVYNDDDMHVLQALEGAKVRRIPFSTAKKVAGIYANEAGVFWAPQGEVENIFDLGHCSLLGLHNQENICAAIACAKSAGVADSIIQNALNTFRGLPHRVEFVARIGEANYYDDSKATNVGAVVMSLASFEKDIVLILGGRDKGGDYKVLAPLLRAKARAVLVLGEAKAKIMESLQGTVELISVADMKEAVVAAHAIVPAGGTVLLSPACSSFDMFRDYHERGQVFQKYVLELE